MTARIASVAIAGVAGLVGAAGLAGCEDDPYPVRTGTGGGTGMTDRVDAAPRPDAGGPDAFDNRDGGRDDGDGGVAITGDVCVLFDVRFPASCATSGKVDLAEIQVGAPGGIPVGTDALGGFEVVVSGSLLEAARVDLAPSLIAIPTAGRVVVPIVDRTSWDAIVTSSSGVIPDGSGSIAAYFVDQRGLPLTDVAVLPPEGAATAPLYDGADALVWAGASTGTAGAVLLLGVPAGLATLEAPDLDTSVAGIPVASDRVTFVRVVVAAP